MNVITKLALTRIRSKKTRSLVICAAIFLTIVLFMTVVSISSNLLSSFGLTMRLASGTDYHGYLRTAAFTLPGQELRDAAKESNDIAEAVISSNVAQYALEEDKVAGSSDSMRAVESEKVLAHFYTEIIEGKFPQSDDEILVNPLYFPDAKVGDSIGLYYSQILDSYTQTAYAEFKISGLIESSTDAQLQVILRYSDALAEKYGFTSNYLNVYFMFGNTLNIAGKLDKLVDETLGEYKLPDLERYGILNSAYLGTAIEEALNPANIFTIIFAVAVVFLCSFLLIYNIYSIALTQDMQSFGLLNVIGTTHKQLRRMITIQSVVLFAATLPVGLIAGYFIGWKLLSPVLFSMSENDLKFEFSPWIIVFTIILTLFTLLWSATRPLKKLRSLTPIATVDYSPAADLPKRYVRKKNYKKKNSTPNTGRLAKYTISRNRKKTVITALSMSISVILFVLIATICDYMAAYTIQHLNTTDFVIRPLQYYTITGSNSEYHPVPENAADELNGSLDSGFGLTEEFVQAVENLTYTEKVWKIRTAMYVTDTPAQARSTLRGLKEKMTYWWDYRTEALNGKLYISVVGIPDELFGELVDSDIEKIGEGYEEGYVIYDASYTQNLHVLSDDGGSVGYYAFNYFNDGDSIKLNSGTYRIMTNTWGTPMIYLANSARNSTRDVTFYLPESAFIREFGEGLTYALLADAKEDCYDLLYSELEAMSEDIAIVEDEAAAAKYAEVSNSEYTYIFEPTGRAAAMVWGKYDNYEEMRRNTAAIQTVGYSLAAMIFLIGALNIVNTALSSATERRREFAMLEAVGMTDKQMMRMLLTESFYSGGMAVLITVCVGFPIIAIIINTAMDALVSLNWLAGVIMLAVCIAVSALSGLAVFRLTKSDAVVERIKVE